MNLFALNEAVLQAGQVAGYLISFAVIFGETGTLLGSILPGDTFLVGLGIAASQGLLNIWILVPVCLIAGILGDTAGYWFGKKVGEKLYNRPDSRFIKQAHIQKAREVYLKNSKTALVVARFTPVIRSLAPIIAGVSNMPYRTFALYNVLGAVAWVLSMLFLGYFLGTSIPNIDKYIVPIAVVILAGSVTVGIRETHKATK